MNHSVYCRLLKVQGVGSLISYSGYARRFPAVFLPGTDVDVTSGYSWLFHFIFFPLHR